MIGAPRNSDQSVIAVLSPFATALLGPTVDAILTGIKPLIRTGVHRLTPGEQREYRAVGWQPLLRPPGAGIIEMLPVDPAVAGARQTGVFRGNEQSIAAESGDTTLIESTAHQRIVIEGSGELILVKFTQLATV